MPERKKQLSVALSEKERTRIHFLAGRLDVRVSELMRDALGIGLDRIEKRSAKNAKS